MSDIFSASGFFVHRPCGPRKSGMPESVEIPAPVSTTTLRAWSSHSLTARRSLMEDLLRDLDLAAAAHARNRALRHDDGRGGLAPQLLQLLDRALDRLAGERAELFGRLLERAGTDLEADRQRAGGREHLRLARVEDRARLVALAILADGREPPDG